MRLVSTATQSAAAASTSPAHEARQISQRRIFSHGHFTMASGNPFSMGPMGEDAAAIAARIQANIIFISYISHTHMYRGYANV